MKNKKIILLVSIIIIFIIVITVVIVSRNVNKENIIVEEFDTIYEDGTKINTSEKLLETKKLDELELTEIKLSCRNGISTLIAKVTNNGNTKTQEQEVSVEVLDKEENVIVELKGLLLPINPGESTTLNLNISSDIAGAYDFRISK